MARAALFDQSGKRQGEVDLPDAVFGISPNESAVHEALVWQMAGRHQGTHATKTRGDVRGGGRKPWRQKGTGRARHGSRRSPIWSGGGVTFGPHPRSHAYPLSQAVRHLAVRSLLADRARDSRVIVVERLRLDEPRTRKMAIALEGLGLQGRSVVLVTATHDPEVVRAARNLPGVTILTARTLNVHDLASHTDLVVERGALDVLTEIWGAR